MDKRANGIIVFLIGLLFIVASFAVMVFTISGVMDQALHLDLLPAMQRYFIGAVFAIILLVIGLLILILGR